VSRGTFTRRSKVIFDAKQRLLAGEFDEIE
jgi:hypothetical protein